MTMTKELLDFLKDCPIGVAARLEGVSDNAIRMAIKEGRLKGRVDHRGRHRADVSHHVTGKAEVA